MAVEKVSALNALQKACLKKPFRSFKDLDVGEYIVESFALVETKFGKRLRINLVDTYMYLPERFSMSLDDAALSELNSSPKIMVYSGKDMTDKDRLMLDFKDVPYFA